MCIYTLKRNKNKKELKIPQKGCATPPSVPKLGISDVKDTAKLSKIEASHVAYK